MLNDLKIYKIIVTYEYDEGWCWDTNNIDIIDTSESSAINKAKHECTHRNLDKKDINVTKVEVTSTINLLDIYNSTGVLNYFD